MEFFEELTQKKKKKSLLGNQIRETDNKKKSRVLRGLWTKELQKQTDNYNSYKTDNKKIK